MPVSWTARLSPVLERPGFNVYLVNGSEHCLTLTNDPELAIGVVLIRVVNRQSFHWSMDITVPLGGLALFAVVLVALASAASVLAARRAMGMDALRAVREDW